MKNVNLLQETIEKLEENGKSAADVKWVGAKNGKLAISWEKYAQIADKEYACDSQGQLVAKDLVIVGESWWMERKEYEGAEWWTYLALPQQDSASEFSTLFATEVEHRGWLSLEELREKSGKSDKGEPQQSTEPEKTEEKAEAE